MANSLNVDQEQCSCAATILMRYTAELSNQPSGADAKKIKVIFLRKNKFKQ
jgi:hypothetical protein